MSDGGDGFGEVNSALLHARKPAHPDGRCGSMQRSRALDNRRRGLWLPPPLTMHGRCWPHLSVWMRRFLACKQGAGDFAEPSPPSLIGSSSTNRARARLAPARAMARRRRGR